MDRLQRQVDGARAKLVLVGDNRQLSSIDAGGALRSLSKTLSAHVIELTTNRRQSEVDQEWERQALVQLRNGDIAPAIAAYDAHDRIAVATDVVAARQQLIDRWWSVHAEATTAIMAVTRADVAALNELARATAPRGRRARRGDPPRLGQGVCRRRPHPVREERPCSPGIAQTPAAERPRWRSAMGPSPPSSPSPGTEPTARPPGRVTFLRARVTSHRGNGTKRSSSSWRRANTSPFRRSTWRSPPPSATPSTVFRSQGITVDHAFLLGNDTLFQEAGYTALSRGRLSNHLYAVAPENPRAEIAHLDEVTPHQDALAGLVDALSRSHEQTMALESLPAGATGAAPRLMVSGQCLDRWENRPQPSVEEWFQRFGRDLARNEERAHEPPTPDPGLSWSYDDDLSYGRDYDDGFGL